MPGLSIPLKVATFLPDYTLNIRKRFGVYPEDVFELQGPGAGKVFALPRILDDYRRAALAFARVNVISPFFRSAST